MKHLTIGEVSRRTGLPVRTIRFYEALGLIPPPARTEGGYRLYSPTDIRRLRLAKRARVLGLSLPQIKVLLEQAFAADCGTFAKQFLASIDQRRAEIGRQMAELEALRQELAVLEAHIRHAQDCVSSDQLVAECPYCPLIDEEGGEPG